MLGQPEVRNFILVAHRGDRAPVTGAICCCFPKPWAGRWIRSGALKTRTSTYIGWWHLLYMPHCQLPFIFLPCHVNCYYYLYFREPCFSVIFVAMERHLRLYKGKKCIGLAVPEVQDHGPSICWAPGRALCKASQWLGNTEEIAGEEMNKECRERSNLPCDICSVESKTSINPVGRVEASMT